MVAMLINCNDILFHIQYTDGHEIGSNKIGSSGTFKFVQPYDVLECYHCFHIMITK